MPNIPPPCPGSPEAVGAGCTCAVIDNGHGRGAFGGYKDESGSLIFFVTENCPLHGPKHRYEPTIDEICDRR